MTVSTVELRVESSNAIRELNRVNKQTNVLAKSVGKLGVRLAQLETARRFFKGFREADSAAAAVETLGVNSRELKKELLGVTAEINGLQSQTQLLAASYDVASAGFNDAASAAKILKAASLGATGGLSDLNTVADATTSVLNAYGLSSEKAAKLVDGFIQTQNDGKIVVAQYAGQIGRVAPIAAAAGVGIEELNAAISTVTATGVPVESTFAGLRQVIASIIKPTDEAKKVSEALGLEFNSAAIKAKGFGGFLEDVVEKTGGSEVALTKLFGSVEAVAAILPLTNDGLVSFNKNLQNQATSAGAAELAAKTLGGTVTNQIQAIVNDMGTLARQLDETLGPVIKGLFAEVKKLTGEFVKFFALIQNAPSALEVFKGNLAGFFGAQSQGIDSLVSAVNMLDTSTIKTEEDAKQLEASIRQIQYALGVLKANTTDKQLIDRGVADEISHIALRIDDLQDKLRQLRNAGLDAGGKDTTKPTGKSPLQQQIDALLASLSDGGAKDGKTEEQTRREALERQQQAAKNVLRIKKQDAQLLSAETEKERDLLQLQFDKLDLSRQFPLLKEEELQPLRDQLEIIFGLTQADKDRIQAAKDLKQQQDAEAARVEKLAQQYQGIADTLADGVVNALKGAVDGTTSLGDAATSLLNDLGNQMLQLARNMLFFGNIGGSLVPGGGILGSIFGGFMAKGGTVTSGRSYVVGEQGPELFTPGRSGSIAPSGSFGDTNVVVNVDASGSQAQGNQPNAKALGAAIGAAVQAELVKQKRPGGLLS